VLFAAVALYSLILFFAMITVLDELDTSSYRL